MRHLIAEQSVVVHAPRWLPVQGDGEFLGYPPVEVKVVPRAVEIAVPEAGGREVRGGEAGESSWLSDGVKAVQLHKKREGVTMAVGDVVRVLMEYYEDGEETFERRHGSGAPIAARDMADLVRRELGGQLDYDTLWAEFEAAPRETRPVLTGLLEALVEADPGLAHKLDQLMQDYRAARGPVSPGLGRETPEAEASEFAPP